MKKMNFYFNFGRCCTFLLPILMFFVGAPLQAAELNNNPLETMGVKKTSALVVTATLTRTNATCPGGTGSLTVNVTGTAAAMPYSIKVTFFDAANAVIGTNAAAGVAGPVPYLFTLPNVAIGNGYKARVTIESPAGTVLEFVDLAPVNIVVVRSNASPTIVCPANSTINLASCATTGAITWTDPTATDNCGGALAVVQIGGPAKGAILGAGAYLITYRTTDPNIPLSGVPPLNPVTCNFTVTLSASCGSISSFGVRQVQDASCEAADGAAQVNASFEGAGTYDVSVFNNVGTAVAGAFPLAAGTATSAGFQTGFLPVNGMIAGNYYARITFTPVGGVQQRIDLPFTVGKKCGLVSDFGVRNVLNAACESLTGSFDYSFTISGAGTYSAVLRGPGAATTTVIPATAVGVAGAFRAGTVPALASGNYSFEITYTEANPGGGIVYPQLVRIPFTINKDCGSIKSMSVRNVVNAQCDLANGSVGVQARFEGAGTYSVDIFDNAGNAVATAVPANAIAAGASTAAGFEVLFTNVTGLPAGNYYTRFSFTPTGGTLQEIRIPFTIGKDCGEIKSLGVFNVRNAVCSGALGSAIGEFSLEGGGTLLEVSIERNGFQFRNILTNVVIPATGRPIAAFNLDNLAAGNYSFVVRFRPTGGVEQLVFVPFTIGSDFNAANMACIGGSALAPGLNISLAANCSTPIRASQILNNGCGTINDADFFVEVKTLGGTIVAGATATAAHIGKVLQVSVEFAPGGVRSGIKCWGYVLIEDKTPPRILTCVPNIVLTCAQATSVTDICVTGQFNGASNARACAAPSGTVQECSKYEQSYVDAGTINPCTGGVITRTWTLKDQWGQTAPFSVCVQTITVTAAPVFVAPASIPGATLQCQDVTDAMKLAILAGTDANAYTLTGCGLSVNYRGARIIDLCGTSYKVIRQWEVIDMCNAPMIKGPIEQIIQVVDQTAPAATVTYQNYDVTPDADCAYMNGMAMPRVLQKLKLLVPVTADFTTPVKGTVTLPSKPVITLVPRADANVCDMARISFSLTGADVSCGNGAITYSSNDSRIRFNNAATPNATPTATLKVAGGVRVTVTGTIMKSQGVDFTVIVTDACDNTNRQMFTVDIKDNVAPQVVCVEETRATLGSDGTVRIYTQTFNNRSSDNCGIEAMHVRRATIAENACGAVLAPNPDACWNEYVDFNCGDLNRTDIMVVLRAVDAAGNFSDCMVNVTVDDKTGPICMKPLDIGRICTDNDLLDYRALFTTPSSYDNCGIRTTTFTDNPATFVIIGCAPSSVTRTWVFTDCNANTTTCSQTLTVTPKLGFRVTRLANETPTCAPASEVNAAFLEAEKNRVIAGFELLDCNGVKTCSAPVVEVEAWEFRSSQYCKIFRIRYTIVDHCYSPFPFYEGANYGRTPGNCVSNTPGTPVIQDRDGAIVFERFIYVRDTEVPTSANVAIGAICDGATVAAPGKPVDADATFNCVFGFNHTLTGSDVCNTNAAASTPDKLYYMWKLQRLSPSGIFIDTVFTGSTGTTSAIALRNLKFGSYRVVYRITDLCGNMSLEYYVTVSGADCKAPEILVHNKVVALAGVPGSIPLTGMASLNYLDIANRITDNCDGDLTFGRVVMEIVLASDPTVPLAPRSATPNATVMFNCSHVGTQRVRIWIADAAGNWNFAVSTITVQDNDGICGPRPPSVAGTIGTETNSPVKDVVVSAIANGIVAGSATSPAAGTYLVNNLTAGANYQVRAAKTIDTDKKNGVTTLDIALISKHNLGIEALNSPYKIIAADVNKDGEVDATDMLHIRRFILNITPSLPAGSAWRFVDKSYTFRNAANPLGEDFSEVVNLSSVPAGQSLANFTAVKLGDVNNSFDATQVRGSRALIFNANDMNVVAGNEYTVAINAENFNAAAFQGTFAFEGASVKAVKAGSLNNTSDANFGMFNNAVTASWNGKSEASADVVNITFVATKSGKLSEMLTVNSSVTMAEGYDAAGNAMNVSLKFNTGKVAGGEFALYQNTPNPVATSTTIGFNLPKDGQAKLTIYTAEGKVLSVINNTYKAGVNQVTVNKADLNASGMLYYRLDTQDNSSTRKMIIIE